MFDIGSVDPILVGESVTVPGFPSLLSDANILERPMNQDMILSQIVYGITKICFNVVRRCYLWIRQYIGEFQQRWEALNCEKK